MRENLTTEPNEAKAWFRDLVCSSWDLQGLQLLANTYKTYHKDIIGLEA